MAAGPIVFSVPVAYADNPAGVELMATKGATSYSESRRPDGSAIETQHRILTESIVEFAKTKGLSF